MMPTKKRARTVAPLVIAATALGFALVQLDVSIVNVALVTIGKDLGGGVVAMQWIVDAYTIAFASLLLSAGALGDRIGARRMYLTGFVVFMAASIACGIAPTAWTMIVARIVQGGGAALIVPASLALLNHAAAGNDGARAKAVSLWTLAGSVALAAGPIVGGALVQSVGWRAIFFVNVPLALVGIWLVFRALEETQPGSGALDLPGLVFGIVALATLTGTFIVAGASGWTSAVVLALFVTAIASSAAFLAFEARAKAPMLPLKFFKSASFSTATLIGFALNLTLYGTIFLLGLYFQRTLRYTSLDTGLGLLPFCISLGASNVLSGRLTARYGPRLPIVVGLIIAIVGSVAFIALQPSVAYVALLAGLLIYPFGIGLAVPAMTAALLAGVDKTNSGVASGVLNTVRQAGGAIGVALFGTLFAARATVGTHIAFVGAAALLAAMIVVSIVGLSQQPKAA